MNDDMRWQAVVARDRSQDGSFVYGVTTTGVYCRPGCAARRPQRRNVRFYASAADAERDGLRACRRCRPRDTAGADPMLEKVHALCRFIQAHPEENLRLAALSRRVEVSPFQLQRRFKAIVGLSPKEYADACRLRSLKRGLRRGDSVTEAIYGAGFGSSSRVYERAGTRLGMTPRQYRHGGQGAAISYAVAATPLGRLLIAATDRGLCSVQFGERDESLVTQLRKEYPGASIGPMPSGRHSRFEFWMRALTAYLDGAVQRLELPLDIRGTAFQHRVWNYLRRIPYGEVRSYAEVARAVGRPAATRAVGAACGANPVALLVPCHRVIRGDGTPGGYRWGLARKRAVMARERAARARR